MAEQPSVTLSHCSCKSLIMSCTTRGNGPTSVMTVEHTGQDGLPLAFSNFVQMHCWQNRWWLIRQL